ncbi:MAG: single-stranded DNA-binding protein [Eubacteriales bacterium]|nr:single-stranded DNA-binding protein [Eubacteriales bacterium]
MNIWHGIGNITKDLELKTTPGGKSVVSFTIAINRGFGDKKETDYISCVAWESKAENLCRYMSKGKKIAVEGRLQVRSYDGSDGKKRYVTEVVCGNIEFISPMSESEPEWKQERRKRESEKSSFDDENDFEPLDDESCPF